MREHIGKEFLARFGSRGEQYASGGRINLIGEHTDYNGGFVFPGAIDKCIVAEIKLNGTESNLPPVSPAKVRACSLDLGEYVEFGLNEEEAPSPGWARYIFGVCREIIKRGRTVKGFDTVFAGNVPLGAGMSSSAALESVYAFALNDILHAGLGDMELARIGQATEHNYCGVKCGIMDQFASVFGKKGSLIRLDCRSLEYKYFPFHPDGYKLVLLDSVVKHELASSAYNKRRESCERVVEAFRKNGCPQTKFLREVSLRMLENIKDRISAEDFKRAKYVVEENERVREVGDALEKNDYETVGKKMYETHEGLSKLYEVSCQELDYLNGIARSCGVTGARLMGGGFGGCTLNLVKEDLYEHFIKTAREKYEAAFGRELRVYEVVIGDGARKL